MWGDGASVGGRTVFPSVDLELRESDGTEIEHVGGDSIPAADLVAEVWAEDDRTTVELGDELEGEFEEGETVPLGIDAVEYVTLRYDGHTIGYVRTE